MPIKVILILLLNFGIFQSIQAQEGDSIYTNVERMPYFTGCSAYYVGSKERRQCSNQALTTYISNHLIYPQAAKDSSLEGAVFVRFVIDEQGKVQEPVLLKDIGGGCGTSAIAMLENMPDWEPAYHRGKNVKVALDLPIHFYLKDNLSEDQKDYSISWGKLTAYKVNRKALRQNLKESIQVWTREGTRVDMSSLQFSYGKNKKVISKTSNGEITKSMKKLVKRMKKDSKFSIIATIQKNGQFIEVVKDFLVVE